MQSELSVSALFAGIGGLDLGFHRNGFSTLLMSEWDPAAQQVLRSHFGNAQVVGDISDIPRLPRTTVVTGGFPCQDISLAGTRLGLSGKRSSMVWHMFRLLALGKPEFVVMENVSNLLRLQQGAILQAILLELESLGYRWAYRLVDSRGFGLPQRRQRVVVVATRGPVAPADVLFSRAVAPEVDDAIRIADEADWYGFYWTEGKRGIGWARNAVPTIKGGSALGIPSPPAIYIPEQGFAGTPTIRDAERLQGFASGWTDVKVEGRKVREGERWKMVGNAVSVPVSTWLARAIADPSPAKNLELHPYLGGSMPNALMGSAKDPWQVVTISTHVAKSRHVPLASFLLDPLKPLSAKALAGYISRVESGDRVIPSRMLRDLRRQLQASK